MKTIYLFLAFPLFFLTACSSEATLDENYWETIEAGAYKFTSAKKITYTNGVFVSETPIEIGNSYVLLETTNYDGFFNNLSFFGDWNLQFSSITPHCWNMENDSKRLTFSRTINGFTTSIGTMTIDDVGKKTQTWHFVDGNTTTYNHYVYTVERTTKPD